MVNDQIVNYLITWLCYGDEEAAKRVAYTADEKALETYDLIIVPNGHLGKDLIVPELTRPVVEQPAKDKTIIRTDIVYSAFFFTSRAEDDSPPRTRCSPTRAAFSSPGSTSTHVSSSSNSTCRCRKKDSDIYTSLTTSTPSPNTAICAEPSEVSFAANGNRYGGRSGISTTIRFTPSHGS